MLLRSLLLVSFLSFPATASPFKFSNAFNEREQESMTNIIAGSAALRGESSRQIDFNILDHTAEAKDLETRVAEWEIECLELHKEDDFVKAFKALPEAQRLKQALQDANSTLTKLEKDRRTAALALNAAREAITAREYDFLKGDFEAKFPTGTLCTVHQHALGKNNVPVMLSFVARTGRPFSVGELLNVSKTDGQKFHCKFAGRQSYLWLSVEILDPKTLAPKNFDKYKNQLA